LDLIWENSEEYIAGMSVSVDTTFAVMGILLEVLAVGTPLEHAVQVQ